MNYVPVVVAGTSCTNFSGTKDAASQDMKKDVSSLRYIDLPNVFHKAHLESSTSNDQDACNADAPESSGNSNPTATSPNPSADQMETLIVETPIPIPLGFQDPEFPDRVYKVEKAMYGLHQAPRACYVYVDDIIFGSSNPQLCREFEDLMHEKFQMSAMGELNFFIGLQVLQKKDVIFLSQDKYVGDILKNFGYSNVRSANTPMDKEDPWGKDGPGKDVELHLYRSMIGSLMYLTASRPDIMFAVCACARPQVTRKECHMHAVKRIFRYLKGHPKLGLWYTKESPFDLVAYSNSDYGGATQDRKSTTRGCQFLRRRLISWQCKKQTIVATSITEAEYIAAASGCGQVLWIQNQLLDYGYNFMNTKIYIANNSAICIVKNPVYQCKTKHIEIKHHFIRDCFEKKLISVDHIHTDDNVADLLTKPFDAGRFQYLVVLHIRQFWSTARIETTNEGTKILATVDGQDRENIIKTSALPYDSTPMVTSLDADKGNKDKRTAELSGDDAPIKGRSLETGEEVGVEEAGVERSTKRGSNDTEEMVNVLDAANILTSGVQAVSVPLPLKFQLFLFPLVVVWFPLLVLYLPLLGWLHHTQDVKIARDAEIARIHAEEELKMLIDGLDRNNELIAKYLQENHAGWKTKQFRGMTLEENREKFILVWNQIEDFVPIASKEEGKRVKRIGLKLEEGSAKKIKTSKNVSE
nr:hypothetical protein [Tanacetum cinerariifolium]